MRALMSPLFEIDNLLLLLLEFKTFVNMSV